MEKHITLILTQEEIDSSEPIEVKVHIRTEDETDEEGINYTIKYPKL